VTLEKGEEPENALAAEDAGLKLKIAVRKSAGQKCARCWNYYPAEKMDKEYPDICRRCGPVVKHHPGKSPGGAA
jgi:isoleucyl-tRNA synthetase